MSNDLLVDVRGSTFWLTLNRPTRLNAFTWELRDEILIALESPEARASEAIVLTGAGRAFCAGVDLDVVLLSESGAPAGARRRQLERTHDVIRMMRTLPQPIVALVNGVAAGGGWSLALGTDYILASEKARFVTAFTKLALVPDLAGAFHLSRRIGTLRSKSIIFRGQSLDAQEALACNAIDAVAPADRLESEFERRLPEILAAGKRRQLDVVLSQ